MEEGLGYISYENKEAPPGVMDAGKAGLALTGLNEALRYFNARQAPELVKIDYEMPTQVRAGSWEAVVLAGAGAFAVAYLGRAANEMAKKDFEDVGFSDVIRKSFGAIVYLVRLVKHTGKFKGWTAKEVTPHDGVAAVTLVNENGESLHVPVEYFRWFSNIPPRLLSKMVEVVEEQRPLLIGAREGDGLVVESITAAQKRLFVLDADEELEEWLFPELVHGAPVRLEGRLTRGNAETNSVGLDYKGHILNCIPAEGSVVQFKSALFLNCVVEGTVTRLHKSLVAERRPTIIIQRLTPLEFDGQAGLF